MKSMLKERKNKSKKKADASEADDKALDDMLEGAEALGAVEGAEDEAEDAMMAGTEIAADDAMSDTYGDDPVKVFADILELDELTAQAIYSEAMSLEELSEMSPDAMANKIKGNYDLLKKIMTSMGEKAAMAMQDELNQPMEAPPEMAGPPGMEGPPMPGAPPALA